MIEAIVQCFMTKADSDNPPRVPSKFQRGKAMSTLKKVVPIAACIYGLGPVSAQASCVDLIRPPMTMTRANFAELEKFVPSKSLNPHIDEIQDLASTGQGQLNIDQFSIVLDAKGDTAASFMTSFRSRLGDLAYTGDAYGNFGPYDTASTTLWKSSKPKGALMVFTLKKLMAGGTEIMPLEKAAVVVSCFDGASFVFTPSTVGSMINPTEPGLHPVSGNRGFGVEDTGNGSLTVYVKATDRVVDRGIFKVLATDGLREIIFQQGYKVWIRMLEHIEAAYPDRHPRDKIVFSKRVDF